ncbi:MAG: Mpo1-like protein [Metallibacterium sp.]
MARFSSFAEFYPFYLGEHRNNVCRRLHFIGSCIVLLLLLIALLTRDAWWLLLLPVVGYGFAWIGHFFFEKNRPATFQYPWYSLIGDWRMFIDVLRGRVRL